MLLIEFILKKKKKRCCLKSGLSGIHSKLSAAPLGQVLCNSTLTVERRKNFLYLLLVLLLLAKESHLVIHQI